MSATLEMQWPYRQIQDEVQMQPTRQTHKLGATDPPPPQPTTAFQWHRCHIHDRDISYQSAAHRVTKSCSTSSSTTETGSHASGVTAIKLRPERKRLWHRAEISASQPESLVISRQDLPLSTR